MLEYWNTGLWNDAVMSLWSRNTEDLQKILFNNQYSIIPLFHYSKPMELLKIVKIMSISNHFMN